MTAPLVLDLSGGRNGGAGRFREHFLAYARAGRAEHVRVLGLNRRVTPGWLGLRECLLWTARRVVAANNVAFFAPGRVRVTLLRNANHFLTPDEWRATRSKLSRTFAWESAQVIGGAKRSDLVVVPSSSMAERVVAKAPSLRDRIVVRFHPVQAPVRLPAPGGPPEILCPVVASPFKQMDQHLLDLARALPPDPRVVVTTSAADAPATLRADPRFDFVGVLPRDVLARYYARCTAVYYPTTVESFGYPLAESRAAGVPVIAQETAHNREIAGDALCGYDTGRLTSLADALAAALTTRPAPDPSPFASAAYFDWLLDRGVTG